MDFEETLACLAVLTSPSLRAITFVRPVSVDADPSIVTRVIDTFVDVLKKGNPMSYDSSFTSINIYIYRV